VTRRLALAVYGSLMLAGSAGAQVGHLPSNSPFRDLEYTQELTLIGGQFVTSRDNADVAPRNGAIAGLHYEWRAAGPAHLIGEIAAINSDRRVINPFLVGAARDVGIERRPLYSANVGLGLSLTGGKSWHNLVPEVAGGLGLISDLRTQADTGGFKFGTRFALTWGGGIRLVPRGRWQVRADVTTRMYTIRYPDAFYITPTGGTSVVPQQQSRSFWTLNPAFTLGISRLF
jgi:hypothetical protein